jgi:hypothetical protein
MVVLARDNFFIELSVLVTSASGRAGSKLQGSRQGLGRWLPLMQCMRARSYMLRTHACKHKIAALILKLGSKLRASFSGKKYIKRATTD